MVEPGFDVVTNPHHGRGLGRGAVDPHVAPTTRGRGGRARRIQAYRPQPPVYSGRLNATRVGERRMPDPFSLRLGPQHVADAANGVDYPGTMRLELGPQVTDVHLDQVHVGQGEAPYGV